MTYPEEVQVALAALAQAKETQEYADMLRRSATEVLLPYYHTNQLKALKLDDGRSVGLCEATVSTCLDKGKFKDALLAHGVDAVTIGLCEQAAREVQTRAAYLQITSPRRKP